MYSLIISYDGEDRVITSPSRQRLEKEAIDLIKEEMDPDSGTWNNFGHLESERILLECLDAGSADDAMELFADISDVRGDMLYMRIVPANMIWDA